MRKLIAIKVQSCTDLITNSSSEIFMLHTDKTAQQVEEALSEFTSGYRKPFLFNLSEYRKHKNDYDKKYEEMRKQFEDEDGNVPDYNAFWKAIDQFDDDNIDLVIYNTVQDWFIDSGDPDDILMVQKDYLNPSWNRHDLNKLQLEFKDFLMSKGINENDFGYIPNEYIPDDLVKEFVGSHNLPSIKEMLDSGWSYSDDVVDLDGCIVVLSEYDNSIPYDDFDKIDDMFNGRHYHLG